MVNIDEEEVSVNQGEKASYDLRNSGDRAMFLRWASAEQATVFQTQLMYTKSYGRGFSRSKLTYGDRAERRFLAICGKDGQVYHLVIDHPDSDYLNRTADAVIRYLKDRRGFTVYGLFNLDTGGKNIMQAFDEDGRRIDHGPKHVREATNLLVYYVE